MSQSAYWTDFMRRRLSRRRLLKAGTVAGAGLLVGSALGCGEGTTGKPGETGQSQGTPTGSGGTAKAPLTGQVTVAVGASIFYQNGGDGATHSSGQGPLLGTTINETLVGLDMDLNYLPSLATSWKFSDDLKTVDFNLRQGVKFHNGDPVTAADVKFSVERAMRPELKWVLGNAFRREIKGIEALDDYKVRFNMNSPFPGLFKRLWWDTPINPKKYVESVGDDGFADKPIGAGPFKWVDYKQDVYMTMEAVPDHYRKPPEFKTLKFVYVADDSTRLAMLKAGEVDIAPLIGPMIQQVKADPSLRTQEIKYSSETAITYCDLYFPNEPSPFLDARVRRAVSHAIDRETICKKVLFEASQPWGQILAPLHLGYDPDLKPAPYDPNKAKSLLAEAGYPNGVDTVFNLNKTAQFWVEAVVADLEKAGIRVKLNVMEAGALQTANFERKLRGLISGISWYDVEKHPAADIEDGYRGATQGAYFKDDKVDELLDKATNASTDEEIAKWGREVNRYVVQNELKTQLWANSTLYGVGPRIGKWETQMGSIPAGRFEYMTIKS